MPRKRGLYGTSPPFVQEWACQQFALLVLGWLGMTATTDEFISSKTHSVQRPGRKKRDQACSPQLMRSMPCWRLTIAYPIGGMTFLSNATSAGEAIGMNFLLENSLRCSW